MTAITYKNATGYPSVTEILKPYLDTRWFTPEHSARGTKVHEYCDLYLAGEWLLPALPIEYQGYFDSFKRWADQTIDRVILAEERLIDSALGFCGKPDFIGTMKGSNDLVLLDWKTSQTYQSWFPLQGEAYRHLARVDRNIETTRSASVRLKADGTGCLVDYAKPEALNIFWGILNAHHFFNK